MRKLLLTAAALALVSTSAFAFDPVGPVNTDVVLRPDHSKVPTGQHYTGEAAPGGPIGGVVDTRAVLSPDHSKVAKTAHYKGDATPNGAIGGVVDQSKVMAH